mmetsp:Transcript_27331/g.43391  ORF Transcript_27331/g.43391 Transcript_27331/m.43391 type:complete len:300 (+) Transcript_27331:44-943(+)
MAFVRPTLKAKIQHKKEIARFKRDERKCLRKLQELPEAQRKTTPEVIKAHYKTLRARLERKCHAAIDKAKITEEMVGTGCTCPKKGSAEVGECPIVTLIERRLRILPRVVANMISLYLPPGSTPKKVLTDEQAEVIGRVLQGENVFFTGRAGTGKSFLLKKLKEILTLGTETQSTGVFFTAMTGIAAAHIGGSTLHSFAGIGMGNGDKHELLKKALNNKPRNRWYRAEILIIDEVSMLSADLFETLSYIGGCIRDNPEEPFGGIQLVFSGISSSSPRSGRRECAFNQTSGTGLSRRRTR